MNILVAEEGVFLTDGKKRKQVEPGWLKYWTEENVYGWRWIGPCDRHPFYDLLVLTYLPNAKEREQIEKRFADAPTPDGAREFTEG